MIPPSKIGVGIPSVQIGQRAVIVPPGAIEIDSTVSAGIQIVVVIRCSKHHAVQIDIGVHMYHFVSWKIEGPIQKVL